MKELKEKISYTYIKQADLRKTCDNCKDYNKECKNGRSGWICGHWREDENNQLSFF